MSGVQSPTCCTGKNDLGTLPPSRVLDEKRVDGLSKLNSDLTNPREDVALFQWLMEALDEIVDDRAASWVATTEISCPPSIREEKVLIDEENSLQHTMLLHRVHIREPRRTSLTIRAMDPEA
jgi:hypothetical protein